MVLTLTDAQKVAFTNPLKAPIYLVEMDLGPFASLTIVDYTSATVLISITYGGSSSGTVAVSAPGSTSNDNKATILAAAINADPTLSPLMYASTAGPVVMVVAIDSGITSIVFNSLDDAVWTETPAALAKTFRACSGDGPWSDFTAGVETPYPNSVASVAAVASESDPVTRARSIGSVEITFADDGVLREFLARGHTKGRAVRLYLGSSVFVSQASFVLIGTFVIHDVRPEYGAIVVDCGEPLEQALDNDVVDRMMCVHPVRAMRRIMELAGVPSSLIDAATFDETTAAYSSIQHWAVSRTNWYPSPVYTGGAASAQPQGLEWTLNAIDTPTNAKQLIDELSMMLNATAKVSNAGIYSLEIFDRDAAVDRNLSEGDVADVVVESTQALFYNRVIVNGVDGAALYSEEDTASRYRTGISANSTALDLVLDNPWLGAHGYLRETIVDENQTTVTVYGAINAGFCGTRPNQTAVHRDDDGGSPAYPTQRSGDNLSVSGPERHSYLMLVDSNGSTEIVRARAGSYWDEWFDGTPGDGIEEVNPHPGSTLSAIGTDSSNVLNRWPDERSLDDDHYFYPSIAAPKRVLDAYRFTSVQRDQLGTSWGAGWNCYETGAADVFFPRTPQFRVYDITIAVAIAQSRLARFKDGCSVIRFRAPLKHVDLELGDFITFPTPVFVKYGKDGSDSTVVWEIIRKEIAAFDASPGVIFTCAWVRDENSVTAVAGYPTYFPNSDAATPREPIPISLDAPDIVVRAEDQGWTVYTELGRDAFNLNTEAGQQGLNLGNTTDSFDLTIISPPAGTGGIYFNDGADAASIVYNHSTNILTLDAVLQIDIPDNTATAFRIYESGASTNYFHIATTNDSEVITIGNALAATAIQVDDNRSSAFRVFETTAGNYINLNTTDGSQVLEFGNSSLTTFRFLGSGWTGINVNTPLSRLHVLNIASGASAVRSGAVITAEGSSSSYLQLLTGSTSGFNSGIAFGHESNTDVATIAVTHGATPRLSAYLGGSERIGVTSTGAMFGDTSGTFAIASRLHVLGSGGGSGNAESPRVQAGTMATIEDGGSNGAHLSFLVPDNRGSTIYFGQASNNDIASIGVDHANGRMTFVNNTATMLRFESTGAWTINGSAGTSGNVLVCGGAALPSWTAVSALTVTLGASNFATPTVEVLTDASSFDPGSGATAMRSNARLILDTAAPSSIGTANAQGSATTSVRSDHVHNFPMTASGGLTASGGNFLVDLSTSFTPTWLGAHVFGGILTAASQWRTTGRIAPTSLAADQNDYNPTDLATATIIDQDQTAARILTGLQGGATGRRITLRNGSSFSMTLAHESASSSAANRFYNPNGVSFVIPSLASVELLYNASRWCVLGDVVSASSFPLLAPDGSAAAPSYSFASDTDCGLYRVGANDIALAVNGTYAIEATTAAVNIATLLRASAGTAGAPSLSFFGDTDSGLYASAADTLALATGGTARVTLSTTALGFNVLLQSSTDGSAAAPVFTWASDPNSGMYRVGADDIAIAVGGSYAIEATTTAVNIATLLRAGAGAASAPSISFYGDTDSGMYSSAANTLGFATNGTARVTLSTTDLSYNVLLQSSTDGSAAAPVITWASDPDSGFYRVGANDIAVTVAGAYIQEWASGLSNINGVVRIGNGDATTPALAFISDTNTGLYRSAADALGFTTAGTARLVIGASGQWTLGADGDGSAGQVLTSNGSAAPPTWEDAAGGVTWPLLADDGSVGAPSYSFTNDTDCGIYRAGANDLAMSIGGAFVQEWTATAVAFTQPIRTALESAGEPAYSFTGDTNTGIYSSAADTLDFTTGGTQRVSLSTTALAFNVLLQSSTDGSETAPCFTWASDTDSGLYRAAANDIALTAGGNYGVNITASAVNLANTTDNQVVSILGTGDFRLGSQIRFTERSGDPAAVANTGFLYTKDVSTVTQLFYETSAGTVYQLTPTSGVTYPLLADDGSVGAPAYSFSSDTDCGLYRAGANDLALSVNGAFVQEWTTAAAVFTVPVRTAAGDATAPSHSFSGDTNTGIYASAADTIGMTTGGTARVLLSTTEMNLSLPFRHSADGDATAPVFSWASDTNTGMFRLAADDLCVTTGGNYAQEWTNTVTNIDRLIRGPAGSASAPAFSFYNDTDCGIYRVSADLIGVAAGGLEAERIGTQTTIGTTPYIQWLSASTGGGLRFGYLEETITTNTGTAQAEGTASAVPAGCIVLGAAWRITTTIVISGGSSFRLGLTDAASPDGTTSSLFTHTQSTLTAGTTGSGGGIGWSRYHNSSNYSSSAAVFQSAWGYHLAAADRIRVGTNAGTFTSGVIRVRVYFVSLEALTS